MTFESELRKAAKRLVWLLEIELARRLDNEAWTAIPGHVYVTDSGNDRIKDIRKTDLGFVAQFGSTGAGDDQFEGPWGVCTNGVYIYITDENNNRIKKHLASDFSFVAKFGSVGAGNNNFNVPRAIATDGTFLYIVDTNNDRVKKHRCDDLSFVGNYTGIANGDDHDIASPQGVCIQGTNLWIHCAGGINRFHKVNKDTLAYIAHYHYTTGAGDAQFNNPFELSSDGTNLYIYDQNNDRIKKHLAADFSFISKWGVWLGSCGTSGASLGNGTGIAYHENRLYIVESGCTRIRKHYSSDLTLICVNGHFGAPTDGNDYVTPRTVAILDTTTYYLDIGLAKGHPTRIRGIDRSTGAVVDLDEKASAFEVEWTVSSWYFDDATGLVYLHLPDESDPGAGNYYLAFYFWRRFCDGQYPEPDEVVFNGVWYEPRLKRDSIPDFTQEISGFEEGGVRQAWGPLKLENADGLLDEEFVDYVWESKIYQLKVGARGGAYADFRTVSRGRTGSITWEDAEVTINAEDPLKAED